ncbi:MAG: hypothetical protein ABI345_14445 [Jatrophihabitans sp.]
MSALLFVVFGTAAGMAILVAYSGHLFKENRTRVVRHPSTPIPRPDDVEPELLWRTLVPAPAPTPAARPLEPLTYFSRLRAITMRLIWLVPS